MRNSRAMAIKKKKNKTSVILHNWSMAKLGLEVSSLQFLFVCLLYLQYNRGKSSREVRCLLSTGGNNFLFFKCYW